MHRWQLAGHRDDLGDPSGENGAGGRARLISPSALLAEPSSPFADDLRMTIAAHRDVLVLHPLGRVQDQPRALDITVGQRRRTRTTLKLATILI
jgi:hypothetical protein